MNTIAPHLTVATVLAVRHLSYMNPSAAARTATQSASAMGLTVLILIVAFVVMMTSAARGMAALMSEFLRIAATMTFVTLIVVVVAVALLVHH